MRFPSSGVEAWIIHTYSNSDLCNVDGSFFYAMASDSLYSLSDSTLHLLSIATPVFHPPLTLALVLCYFH